MTVATEHKCAFCAPETRALYHAAENAASAMQDALAAPGGWSVAVRKVNQLVEVLHDLAPNVQRHNEEAT